MGGHSSDVETLIGFELQALFDEFLALGGNEVFLIDGEGH